MTDFHWQRSRSFAGLDPAASFLSHLDTDNVSVFSERNASADLDELIKAARQELQANRAQLDKGELARIAEEFVTETEGVTFAARLAQIAR